MELRKKIFENFGNRFRKVKTKTGNNHKIQVIKIEDLYKNYQNDLLKNRPIISAINKIATNLASVMMGLHQEDRINLHVKDKFAYLTTKNKSVISISDLHLTNFYNPKIWEFLVNTIEEKEVEVVVINGDYFDGSMEVDKMLNNDKFRNIIDKIRKYTSVILLPGNHDYDQVYLPRRRRIDIKEPFFKLPQLKVLSNHFTKYLLMEILNNDGMKTSVWFEHGHRLNVDKYGHKAWEFSQVNSLTYKVEKFLHQRFGDKALKYIPGILKINQRNLDWALGNLHDCVLSIGHSHYPDLVKAPNKLFFANTGSLKQDNNTGNLILFEPNGDISLLTYNNKTDKKEIMKKVNFFE